jgi:alkylation response protein AidB-like acyl-CoA dehydrogenase
MNPSRDSSISDGLWARLAQHAGEADAQTVWPKKSWDVLGEIGSFGWSIPEPYGGQGWNGLQILHGYEKLAGACLTSCFILSQRDGACRRIRDSGNDFACRELLPRLARGERFATVGLSHLTTSRQHLQPALTAKSEGEKITLNGAMPWVTGAAQADHIVTGATCHDGQQILLVLPTEIEGVHVGPPLNLMALAGSITAEVHCHNVEVDRKWLLAGPSERVMSQGKGGTGGLETSCLALGLVSAALTYLHEESAARPDLTPRVQRIQLEFQELRNEMLRLADPSPAPLSPLTPPPLPRGERGGGEGDPAIVLRGRANSLVLRATQFALTAAKGAGFLKQHPAQRWARQAMFFLVWSCPRPAAEATLSYLVNQEPVPS